MTFEAAEAKWGPHPISWPMPERAMWWRFEKRRKLADLESVFGLISDEQIAAFWGEIRKGQGAYEDCGGYLLRCYRAMLGLPVEEPYTCDEALADLMKEAE